MPNDCTKSHKGDSLSDCRNIRLPFFYHYFATISFLIATILPRFQHYLQLLHHCFTITSALCNIILPVVGFKKRPAIYHTRAQANNCRFGSLCAQVVELFRGEYDGTGPGGGFDQENPARSPRCLQIEVPCLLKPCVANGGPLFEAEFRFQVAGFVILLAASWPRAPDFGADLAGSGPQEHDFWNLQNETCRLMASPAKKELVCTISEKLVQQEGSGPRGNHFRSPHTKNHAE
jgi:hypothetical protein